MNMKATQFTTTAGFFMRKTEVFPSDIESVGALKVNVSDVTGHGKLSRLRRRAHRLVVLQFGTNGTGMPKGLFDGHIYGCRA